MYQRSVVQSGVTVFLPGHSGEGKSTRVKQVAPNYEIIYLRNTTLESLNGKSVYNQRTSKIINVKST